MDRIMGNQYEPDSVSPPGETLLETIQTLGISQADLATRIGKTPQTVNRIIGAGEPISPDTAIALERALGVPASFWINRQRIYDEFHARLYERERLQKHIAWVERFPYRTMAQYGWVPATSQKFDRLGNLLNFFGIASPDAWDNFQSQIQASYRRSSRLTPDINSLAAWLRQGEILGRMFACKKYDHDRFERSLESVRALTRSMPDDFVSQLRDICSECGVAVVFVRELPKTASGATRWLSPDKGLLQLSLRYKTDDHLWFTFFHEAAHILLHRKKGIFIENTGATGREEEDANRFATEKLIPASAWHHFPSESRVKKASIEHFAERFGIASGIVVGQLQYKKRIPPSHFNHLKRTLRWE